MLKTLFALALALVAALCVTGTASAAGSYDRLLAPTTKCAPQTDRAASVGAQEAAMTCLINYARQASGVKPLLSTNAKLTASADRKAQDILRCQQFSHTACGREFSFHMKAVGYATGCYGTGENIAWGSGSYGTVRSIMSGWLNSTGHRTNILSPRFRDQGVALRTGRISGYSGAAVWVSHFGYRC
jgi:uncharacterized protein YkwD